jgi:hypothetical protein
MSVNTSNSSFNNPIVIIVKINNRLLLFKPSKHLLRTYTPHLLHNIHLFDIVQLTSQRKDELEIDAKGIAKIHIFKDDQVCVCVLCRFCFFFCL